MATGGSFLFCSLDTLCGCAEECEKGKKIMCASKDTVDGIIIVLKDTGVLCCTGVHSTYPTVLPYSGAIRNMYGIFCH